MKRLLALLMAAMMVLSLAACGSSNTETAETSAPADSAAPAADASGETKTFIIATDTTFAPFEFEDASGKQIGIDIDLINAVAEDQGFTVEIQALGFNAALQALQADQCDGVIAGMSITDERKETFDFSDPYFDSGVVMGIAADSDIAGYEDLKDKNVAIKTGTEGATFAESIMDQYGFTVSYFDDSASMYNDVTTGNSAACFEDYPVLGYGITQGIGLKIVTEKEAGNSYGFAVNKGKNAELLSMFNAGLANLKASGKYDEILATYISE